MSQRIAITGGSGFIGRYLAELFGQAGYLVTILDLVAPSFENGASVIVGDVREKSKTDQLCQGADVCIHLAAAHGDQGISRDEYFSVNEAGTANLLDSMTRHNVRQMIFYSSVAVYNPVSDQPITEATPPDPINYYGKSKIAAERLLVDWTNGASENSCLALRPSVVIGPRNIANMYALIDQIHSGKYKFALGAGDNIKSVAVVSNLVRFTHWAIENQFVPPGQFEKLNFIDSPQLSSAEIIRMIHEELSLKLPRTRVPIWMAVLAGKCFDLLSTVTRKDLAISSARIKKLAMTTRFEAEKLKQTGFSGQDLPEDGVRQMTRWYKDSDGGKIEVPVDWNSRDPD